MLVKVGDGENENIRCFVGRGNALLIALPGAFPRDVSFERIRLSFVIVCFLFVSEIVCVLRRR